MAQKRITALQASYYADFQCTGSACEDNCCHYWHISIDKKTYMQYRKIKDPSFAERFSKNIKRVKNAYANDANYATFVLEGEDKACPYLREDGLCEIHADHGPGLLSHTCLIYPRVINQLSPDMLEFSCASSCPEVVRLGLLSKEPLGFTLTETEVDTTGKLLLNGISFSIPANPDPSQSITHAWAVREACIDMMQNRSAPLAERLLGIGLLLQKITELEAEGQCSTIPNTSTLYSQFAKDGEFAGQLARFPRSDAMETTMSALLFQLILALGQQKSHTYQPFRDFLEGAGVDFTLQDGDTTEKQYAAYRTLHQFAKKQAQTHWQGILDSYGHVLENFYVNYMFGHVFPFYYYNKGLSPYQHFIFLAEQYALLRILLCNAASAPGFGERQVIKAIACLTYLNQHFIAVNHVAEDYSARGLDSLAHLSFLLH